MRKKDRKNEIAYAVLLAVILFMALYIFLPNLFVEPLAELTLPELSTAGFTEVNLSVEIQDNYGTVFLGNDCYVVSADVERSQAVSIQDGIDGKVGPRPNTHDLFNDLLENLDVKIMMIKITHVEDNAYRSNFILRQGNIILNFDARPSDAIAIAARTEYLVPIYFNETLLKEVGTKIC